MIPTRKKPLRPVDDDMMISTFFVALVHHKTLITTVTMTMVMTNHTVLGMVSIMCIVL